MSVALLALAATLPAGAPAAKRAVPADFFAIDANWLNRLALLGDVNGINKHARKMRALGIEAARITADWQTAEPNPPSGGTHHYDFSVLDRAVRGLAAAHVRPTLLFVGSPVWARDSTGPECGYRTVPPNDGFSAFAKAASARYGRGGSFWSQNPQLPNKAVHQFEVWNEANLLLYWCPTIDPARYARLYLATSAAIRSADRRAKVIIGGVVAVRKDNRDENGALLGMSTIKFLSRMLATNRRVRSQIDGIGFHSYAVLPRQNLDLLAWFRRGMRRLGLGREPIIYNEFGWPTKGQDARTSSEKVRAGYVTRTATALAHSDCGISQVAPYTWATAEKDTSSATAAEDWFGIADPLTAAPYRSARAYSTVARLFEGKLGKSPPRRRLRICSG
jgi:hypothetical protein